MARRRLADGLETRSIVTASMEPGNRISDAMPHDLIVIGGSPAGQSLALQARRAGLDDVLILALPRVFLDSHLEDARPANIRHVERVRRVSTSEDGLLTIESSEGSHRTRVCVIDFAPTPASATALDIGPGIVERVHGTVDFESEGSDVLVVSHGESSAVLTSQLVSTGAQVVLAFTGEFDSLSILARQVIEKLEREQRVTVLWRARPEAVWEAGGFPMVRFADRRTPDLQFDHLVIDGFEDAGLPVVEVDSRGADVPTLFMIGDHGNGPSAPHRLSPGGAWEEIRRRHFPDLAPLSARAVGGLADDEVRQLSSANYNATITLFDTAHNELWRIRIRPDRESIAHLPGQYCSLGLGYWEPRADDETDVKLDSLRRKMIRRSYSISSPVFDDRGYLFDSSASSDIELYIVWVRPSEERIPALTPRLALKHDGDRVYLGPRVAGRYTVDPLKDPDAPVVFCATGTGEAPHNAMIVELLRKGHRGPILSIVSVRYLSDLAYLAEHQRLEERFPNYRYLAVPTRERETPKRYLQDLLEDGTIEDALRAPVDPDLTHFFLCGNPAMIGLPSQSGDGPVYPQERGMAELLVRRGFTLDQRGTEGNIHYEEYW